MSTPEADNELWLAHMQEGQKNFGAGKMRAAIVSFKQATDSVPTRVAGWINLSSALLESRQFESAARMSDNAIKLNPKLMQPHMLLGDALRLMGRPGAALSSYETAVSLQRDPAALNRLACALRGKRSVEKAQTLYLEAIEAAPDFNLARINLATLELEIDNIADAKERLAALVKLPLAFQEEYEVKMALRALTQREHLGSSIEKMVETNAIASLENDLRTLPGGEAPIDDEIYAVLQTYGQSAQRISTPPNIETSDGDLPQDWPRIESLFTIPVCSSVSDYNAAKEAIAKAENVDGEMAKSLQVEQAITTARATRGKLNNAYATESHLRHWHSLACQNQPGIIAGHFKYTQYWVPNDPTRRRGEPALCSATIRRFISEILDSIEPGYARAAAIMMAMSDIHPFADGNTRVSLTWMNRELEWAGMPPALFPLGTGLRDQLQRAMAQVRKKEGDLQPMVDVIQQGQQFSREFIKELAQS